MKVNYLIFLELRNFLIFLSFFLIIVVSLVLFFIKDELIDVLSYFWIFCFLVLVIVSNIDLILLKLVCFLFWIFKLL